MEKEFVSVGELAIGFDAFRKEQTNWFGGKEESLYDEKDKLWEFTFLTKEVLKGETEGIAFTAIYHAYEVRENIFFLDFIIPGHVLDSGQATSVSIVIDYGKRTASVIRGVLPKVEEYERSTFERAAQGEPLTAVQVEINFLSLDDIQGREEKHHFTEELIGHVVQFTYSEKDIYEHNYLNQNHYTWQCLKGIEKDLCDTDKCYYIKIDVDLYLFIWIEKVIPTIGVVVEDLDESMMRSYGKICGYEGYAQGKIVNFPVGSYAKKIY